MLRRIPHISGVNGCGYTLAKEIYDVFQAAGINVDHWSDDIKAEIQGFLNDFEFIGIREKTSIPAVEKLSKKTVHWSIDPTFLINKTEWSNLTTNSTDKQNLKVYVPTYTVTFNSNGGSPVLECAVAKGTTIAEPAIIPTRSDLDFCGWVNGNAAYDFTAAVTSDITLTAAWGITLANNDDNSSRIASANDIDNLKVTLADRTLTKDGTWNTLCLPFSLSEEQIEGSPLAGAVIKEMDSSTSLSNDGLLTLNFKNAQSIEAGKAYIVKWETKGENIVNPLFHGVVISNASLVETESTDGKVKFVGQYSPFAIDNDNINEILFIGSGNKIGYSKNPRQLKSCRAHFWVQPNGFSAGARVINLDFGDGMTTSINLVEADDEDASANGIYSLDGRRVKGEPTQKGVYVVNGKKVVK